MKKLLSCLVSIGVLTSTLLSFGSSTSFAATQSVLLGDANGDNKVTYADVGAIQQYLLGYCPVTAKSFTGMDVNQDKIIDSTDAYIIQYRLAYNISAPTVQKELYTLPDNSTRCYKKYTCDTGATTSYTLSNSIPSPNADFDYPVATVSDELDRGNTNVVHLSCGGSGFVVNEHVIATAAHCVYNAGEYDFLSNITVNIYDEGAEVDSSNLIASFEAESYHIPTQYITLLGQDDGHMDNYDYALIYVGTDSQGNDLLDYVSPWQFAIPSLEFTKAEIGQLTTSGFTSHDYNDDGDSDDAYARYYSTGTVIDFSNDTGENHNLPNLRIASNAESYGGKSGGAMYYTSTYNNITHKSIAAVTTGGFGDYKSWGVKINPTLLRFYKQNPYI
jgi:hypothetical protein